MNKTYNHLNDQERYTIELRLKDDWSIRKIATELNRSPSTISRERKRNSNRNFPSISSRKNNIDYYNYKALKASKLALKRKNASHASSRFNYFYNTLKFDSDQKKSIFHNYNDILLDKNFINNPKPCLRTIYNWINQNPTIFNLLLLKKKKNPLIKRLLLIKIWNVKTLVFVIKYLIWITMITTTKLDTLKGI